MQKKTDFVKLKRIINEYHIKKKLFYTVLYILLIIVLYAFGVECLFFRMFHKQCPGCGMTRAMIFLLRGEMAKAFSMHPLFFTIPILYLYILADGSLFKKVYINYGILSLILGSFFILFMIRLFT